MTSRFKTSKYSIFVPVPDITGLHEPCEEASEIEVVFFEFICILPEMHE